MVNGPRSFPIGVSQFVKHCRAGHTGDEDLPIASFRNAPVQFRRLLLATVLVVAAMFGWPTVSSTAMGQQPMITVMGPDGKPRTMPAGAVRGAPATPNRQPGNQKEEDQKGKDGGEQKKGKEEKNDSPEPKIIRRGDRTVGDADPDELKASVGPDGKVAFEFKNQSWEALVEWLADIAERPLDWQELPGDKVFLRAPGRYTVEETMDLFNRHLLARGYTLLDLPGGLTVAKTEGINPAMVPRVTIGQLADLMPHTFVRASLELGWLSSEKMAEELKPMISGNGKLTALTTTNRIEAMDAAINLRQIADLLEQERNESSRDALAPEFKLRHIPAETAKTMLEEFLGVEKKQPMTPQQMQMMQQMAQRNGGKAPPAPKKQEISIVANTRQNSVFIRAPVDRIAVASEFIKRVDVPGQGLLSLSDIEARVQVYRLFSIDPEKLIEIIHEMNVLEPSTRIRADDSNGALIVSGSAADRYIIEKLIKRLDGSGRQFEVLQLRRLDATEVAESISFLMGKEKDDDNNNSSRRFYYYGYGGRDEEKGNEDEFRVAANARFRQVMLWANESEMEQVRNLLVKLGELPPPGGSQRMVRRIDASSSPETYEYLLRLKQQWERVSDAPLTLPDQSEFVDPILGADGEDSEEPNGAEEEAGLMKEPAAEEEGEKPEADDAALSASPPSISFATTGAGDRIESDESVPDQLPEIQSARDFDRLFGDSEKVVPAEKPGQAEPAKAKTPIQIQLDEDGNLVLLSSDTKALDRLENMMLQVAPPKRPYHVFKIKHQSAGYVRLNLVEYFENNEEDDEADRLYRWWYDIDEPADDGPKGLGKNNELRFVYDPDTNTIVVSGATSSQLKTISELIELWDVAEPVNKRRMRYTKLVSLEFGRAEQIAETVKEAYRDLLSSNDKTFAQGRGGRGGGGGNPGGGGDEKSSGRESRGSGLVDSENGRDGGDVDFSFKGKLSIGVDDIGNTLLVSAEGESLLDLVEDMILKLDRAAKPAGDLRILPISGMTSAESVSNILRAFGGDVAPTDSKPVAPPATSPGRKR